MTKKFQSKGLIVNIDINSTVTPFINSVCQDEKITRESFYPFVDQYIDLQEGESQIKAIAYDIFCQFSAVDSKVWTDYYEIWKRKTENGVPVCYDYQYKAQSILNKTYGIDPFEVWFARTRERGMEAWMSIRMNDCHCPDETACFLRSDFFYEAREKGWMIGDQYGYYRHCFDYAVPEVREKMLAYIEEQLGRYDVDALEMDFMREIHCFDYLNCPDKAEIMNAFVRNVKKLVDAASLKWNHKIKLTARLMRDIEQNLVFGFDAATWVKEGLVDHINITPRWESCDSDMPVAEWKKRFPEIEISAGMEVKVGHARPDMVGYTTADVVNGMAANYISQGADEIYLFNYFLNPRENNKYLLERELDIYKRCGIAETVFASKRRHIVMFQDMVPKGCKGYRPLPLKIEGEGTLEVSTGYIPEGKQARLVVGFSKGCPDCVKISVNGNACEDFRPTVIETIAYCLEEKDTKKVLNGYVEDKVSLYESAITLDGKETQTITFEWVNGCVEYIEIVIE